MAPRPRWLGGPVLAAALLAALAVPTSGWARPAALAGTEHQAESATISNGVAQSDHAGYSGSGFVDYDNETGSYVEFAVGAGAVGPPRSTVSCGCAG